MYLEDTGKVKLILMIIINKVELSNCKDYGTGGEGFFRLNIGCPRRTLEEGLKRIKTAIK